MPPTIYIKNALRLSELGLGDGTAYYFGSSAVIDQPNKTFNLTPIAKIDDIATPVDDTLNGHILYFPVSKNKYHIVDFVASTGKVTTWEVPQTVDGGQAWEVRRALLDNKALASTPALRLADGQRFSKWKRSEVGAITIALPNLIKENNGFESGDLSGWLSVAGTPAVNATSPILGKYDAAIGANDRLWARLRGPIENTTYRVLFKARAAAGSAGLGLKLFTMALNVNLDYFWSNQSSGTTTSLNWLPALGTENEWHWADITINTRHQGDAYLGIDNISVGATAFNLDEVYVFEKVNVGAIWLIGEDNSSGYRPTVTGYYAAPSRTSIGASDNLILRSQIYLKHHELTEFAPGIFPIYEINFGSIPPSAGQILLCDKWAWEEEIEPPFEDDETDYDEVSHKSRSGVKSFARHSKQRTIESTYRWMSNVDRDRLLNDWWPHHLDNERHPFAVKMEPGDSPMFVRYVGNKFSVHRDETILSSWSFKFEEVL